MTEKPQIYERESEVPPHARKVDVLPEALMELFFIENPQVKKADPRSAPLAEDYAKSSNIKGVWVYYPWRNLAMRIPPEDIYFRLRTARNRKLITDEEQLAYRNTRVGIAGLSVGSGIVLTLAHTGGPQTIKIADHDTVEITNLNRIRAGLPDVGGYKADIAAREIWEMDPFADIHVWRDGVTHETLTSFIKDEPRLDVFIDEMDSIALKIESRLRCRSLGIPVVMATDIGDGAVVDVERYDLEPDRPIFHGQVDPDAIDLQNLSPRDVAVLTTRIIDPPYFTERLQESVLEIGKTLSGVAQLGTATAIAGAAVASVIRYIASGIEVASGRYPISCEELFIPGYDTAEQRERRWQKTVEFAQSFDITPTRRKGR